MVQFPKGWKKALYAILPIAIALFIFLFVFLNLKTITILDTDISVFMNRAIHSVTLRTDLGNIYLKPLVRISFRYSPYIGSDQWDKHTKNTVYLYEDDFTHDMTLFGNKLEDIHLIMIQFTGITVDVTQDIIIGGEKYRITDFFHAEGSDTVILGIKGAPPSPMHITLGGEITEIH